VVAVVGAGGKTTLVYRLAAEARALGRRVLVTTTTHMGTLPEATTGPVLVEAEGQVQDGLRRALDSQGIATLLGRRIRPDKLAGISPEHVDALAGLADLVLVEADGARGRCLKAPADHEPVVPSSSSLVVVVASLDAIGGPLDEGRVHRVERVAELTGKRPGQALAEGDLAVCLAHPGSYPSRFPPGARGAVFLNKAEDAAAFAAAERIAEGLIPPYDVVVAGRARGGEGRAVAPVAGIVLAAGGSRRMGRPKMLLPLGSGTVLGAAVAPLLDAGLAPVVVVVGSDADEVRGGAGLPDDTRLRVVRNERWAEGMASSLRCGLRECPGAGAVLVALGDQVGVTPERVRRLVDAWRCGAPLAVPVHGDRASHPVVFSRALFPELLQLTGDVGARDVVTRHWGEASRLESLPLRDLDTEEDYAAMLRDLPPRDGQGLRAPSTD
jgi:molybdenum cofactor cytidylyltransferase